MVVFQVGDVIRFEDRRGHTQHVLLMQRTESARAINGVSDLDELFFVGYALNKDLTFDGRRRGKRIPYIAKESAIEYVTHHKDF